MTRVRSNTGWMGYGHFAPIGRNTNKENPFAGTDYASLWENNPYKDLYYQPSFWDYIGLSDKAKDANSEFNRLYNEYNAGIYQLQQQNEYNEPLHQDALNKQAGLNTDLLGINDVGKQSDMNTPNSSSNPALNGVSPAHSALSTISSVLGFATSTLEQIETIKGLSTDNFNKFLDAARPHIINEYAHRFSGGNGYNWNDIETLFGRQYGLAQRKQARKAFRSLLGSSQFSTATELAYSQLNRNDIVMNKYINKMGELSVLAEKHNYQGDISKAIYDKKYFDNLDGSKIAKYDSDNYEKNNWLTKWRHEYYNMLYDEMKKGSKLAGLILIGSNIPGNVVGAVGNLANTGINLLGKKMLKLK